MIKMIYALILLVVGVILIIAGLCKVKFAANFAEDKPEYTERQHKLIGAVVAVLGALMVIFGAVMCFSKPENNEVEAPKKEYCNVCGGDLLCDICGEEGQFCEYSVFKAGDGGHYCSIHWSDCADRYNND